MESKLLPLPHNSSASNLVACSAPPVMSANFKRCHSHDIYTDTNKTEKKVPSVPKLEELSFHLTPLVSNKKIIQGDLIRNQPELPFLDRSDKVDSSSSSSSASSSSTSSSSSSSSSSSNSSESDKEGSDNGSRGGVISERDRSDFDEDFISGTDFEADNVGPDLEDLDELAEGVKASQRESERYPRRRRRRLYRDDKGPFVLEIDDETDEDVMR
jgi:hypothetical protein